MSAVTVNRLSVAFRRGAASFAAVRDAAFTVRTGEIFGLLGPSGCGKTTVLRVLAGLERTWTGDVSVLGTPLHPGRRIEGELRREVQMVFQDPYASLHPRHRIARTLGEPLRARREGDVERRVAAILAEVGLAGDIAARFPHELSGGQRQRIAIARVLLLRPRLLLLDEPTSALDLSVQAGVLNLLTDLRARHGMTMVLVSHDGDVVGHLCDRAARMERGAVVEILDRQGLEVGS
ncbi:ABC transporter ATP-binding protein [Labrys wisconsinensis]|uniref:Glutathione import ATP-binding protein GsiA n=1 Tax=Labrys wisconsinensis TaxID=425677 RepID=A0ABU0J3D6_9HYPH|nr:ABC transporter ATP-binding protein [Labrys wisconsinensis]MDQ0468754.1 peptide/nickel transport system ATP-binding protein [Labrys wisconsinensis]